MLLVSEKEMDAVALSGRTNSQSRSCRRWVALAIFAGDLWVHSPLCREPIPLPVDLSHVQPARGAGHGRVHFDRADHAGRMRGIATFIHESNAIPEKRTVGPRGW